ncbi:MAG: fibrobacter succinogenes major paralogous domain-containing protein, partial [Bacteroidales bacterium]|nr:fibrobacter succinogenes major paralogous domain-containing protein [Bacteroidales bacterium]
FITELDKLEADKTYYFRAWAEGDDGIIYGEVLSFTTSDGIIRITTNWATNITDSSATAGGNITMSGGDYITARGICWSTLPGPGTDDNKTIDGSGDGSFTSCLTGLSADTVYYIRAYAENRFGTQYGQEKSFKADHGLSGTFIDSRDKHEYRWVKIGYQVWMAENLAYLPEVGPPSQGSFSDPYYYVTGYSGVSTDNAKSSVNYLTYGVLYNWRAAENACPEGWHLPSDLEWRRMEYRLGMSWDESFGVEYRGTDEGSKLAGNHSLWRNGELENRPAFGLSGFDGIPGGYRDISGNFGSRDYAYWWTSSGELSTDSYIAYKAWFRRMAYSSARVFRNNKDYYTAYGFSVRCVRD